jgi:hypothetical protein
MKSSGDTSHRIINKAMKLYKQEVMERPYNAHFISNASSEMMILVTAN